MDEQIKSWMIRSKGKLTGQKLDQKTRASHTDFGMGGWGGGLVHYVRQNQKGTITKVNYEVLLDA